MTWTSQTFSVCVLLRLMFPTSIHAQDYDTHIFGNWLHESTQMVDGVPMSQLSLQLQTNEDGIVGQYCYISNYGRRIDCPESDEINVRGALNSDSKVAKLHINSTFQKGDVNVTVTVEDDRLRFVVEDDTSGSLYSGPRDIALTRQN